MPEPEPEPDEDIDEHLGRGINNYLEMLNEMNQPVEADSFEAALEPEDGEYEWLVQTGGYTDDGQPVALKVTAIDPKKQSLLVAYTLSDDKDAAALSLWKACITSPEEITRKDVYENLRTKFKVGVTARLLDMLGQGADFLTGMNHRPSQKSTSTTKGSASQSQTDSDSTGETSETTGQTKKSSTGGSTPNKQITETDETSSKTSDSSSQQPSQTKKSSTQAQNDSFGNVTVGTKSSD